MKSLLLAFITTIAITSCNSNSGSASLKEIAGYAKEIKDAPPYEGPAKEHEQWGPVIYNIEQKVAWLNSDLEGYVIPTESEVDGLEVVWPCEVYSVSYNHPDFSVITLCKVRFTKNVSVSEIRNGYNNSDGRYAELYVLGHNGSRYCHCIRLGTISWKSEDYNYDSATKEKTYLKDTEIILCIDMRIQPKDAENIENINKIVIVSGNNSDVEELKKLN